MIEQRFTLNLAPFYDEVLHGVRAPTVTLSQFDRSSRKLIFELKQGDGDFTIETGSAAAMFGTKPDGTHIAYVMQIEDEHSVSILLPQQASTVAGEYQAEVILYGAGGDRLGSANFYILVENSAANEQSIASETDIPVFTEYVAQAAEQAARAEVHAVEAAGYANESEQSALASQESAQEAAESAERAEQAAASVEGEVVEAQEAARDSADSATLSRSWAVGDTHTRNLEEYDNSKFYSEQAKQAANNNGWVHFYIDPMGYLHYKKTENTEIRFYIENGYLHAVLGGA